MKKVFVGLSGGVDSSVSALLLKQAGYDVTGVFIKVWHPDFIPCDWRAEMRDAMRVCVRLDIPFKMLDLEKEYKEDIIDYLVSEYKEGRTPNPDVMCNKKIKFGKFFQYAMDNGADYVATGHYAQNKNNLFESNDTEKDQTYFLWNIEKDNLSKILFPIGHLKKSEVREIANKNNLNTADKKDSQGLCFIGHVDMKSFLRRFIDITPGDVLDEKNNVIGGHDGTVLYTLGERHGFKIHQKTIDEKPLYVVSKDLNANTITVSDTFSGAGMVLKVKITDLNLLSDLPNTVMCRSRYRQQYSEASVENVGNSVVLTFKEPQEYIAPGQSMVFYSINKDNDGNRECFGGGVING